MSNDNSAPLARYRIAALRIDCPREGCAGGLVGAHGSSLIVRANGYSGGQVVSCEECSRPFTLPGIVEELRD